MNFLIAVVKMKGSYRVMNAPQYYICYYSLRQKLNESHAILMQQIEEHEV